MRHISLNRVYLGEVRLGEHWFPGLHEALVEHELFDASFRGHTKGQRRSRDLLSGRVRCGLCGKVAGVNYNARNQAIYRCRHRGQGCPQSGRSAKGLQRAALLGLQVLAYDDELQRAIREQLATKRTTKHSQGHGASTTIAAIKQKDRKLLELYYADKLDANTFADEAGRLSAQRTSLQREINELAEKDREAEVAIDKFDEVASMLADLDLTSLWEEATISEKRLLVEDLLESVRFFPDHLTVQVTGAPPILVTLEEVGLNGGSRPVVSETEVTIHLALATESRTTLPAQQSQLPDFGHTIPEETPISPQVPSWVCTKS